MAIKEVLIKSMERQKTMREKLTNIEGRTRRNNIRIDGVPEGKESNSVPDFVEQLLKSELALTADNSSAGQDVHSHGLGNSYLRERTRRSSRAEEERLLSGNTR